MAIGGGVGGAVAGAAFGGAGGAMIGGGFGGALSDAWKNTGIIQNKKYNPYDPNAANFQDPNLAGALDRYGQGVTDAQGRQAPQVNAYWQQGNQDLAGALAAQANGQGPSLAQGQFDQAMQQSLAQNASLAGTAATAANPALAQRTLAHQQQAMNQAAAGQSGLLRLQEQMQARGMLANVLASGQQGDIAAGGLTLENQRQMDSQVQFYESLGYSREEANRQAQIEMERIKAGAYSDSQGNQQAQNAGNQGVAGQLLGGVLSAGGAAGAAALGAPPVSDSRQKKNAIKSEAIKSFVDSLVATDFDYKNPALPGAAPGRQTGVMAQDVASTPVGAQMVQQTPNGLALDPVRGIGAALAGLGNVNERLNKMEGHPTQESFAAEKFGDDPEGFRRYQAEAERQRVMGQPRQTTERLPVEAGGMPAPPVSRGRGVLDRLERMLGISGSRGGGSGMAGGTS